MRADVPAVVGGVGGLGDVDELEGGGGGHGGLGDWAVKRKSETWSIVPIQQMLRRCDSLYIHLSRLT